MFFRQVQQHGDNFSYIIADAATREAAVVDSSYNAGEISRILKAENLKLKHNINTHGHSDHTAGNEELQSMFGARIVAHTLSRVNADVTVDDGDVINISSIPVEVIHTPGHTPDSVCYLVGDKLVSGDTLFVGKIGGTGFGDDALAEYESLHGKLMELPDHVEVWPGHDYGVKPSSTIGEERQVNPFLLQPDFESFVDLKKNWLQYKQEHGIK